MYIRIDWPRRYLLDSSKRASRISLHSIFRESLWNIAQSNALLKRTKNRIGSKAKHLQCGDIPFEIRRKRSRDVFDRSKEVVWK